MRWRVPFAPAVACVDVLCRALPLGWYEMGRAEALPGGLLADEVEVHPQTDELLPGVGRERVALIAKARAEVRRRKRGGANRSRISEARIFCFIFACGLEAVVSLPFLVLVSEFFIRVEEEPRVVSPFFFRELRLPALVESGCYDAELKICV